jgi:hypothetical protein
MIETVYTYPGTAPSTKTARMRVVGEATYDEVLDAGLAALGERRVDLYGYGIREGFQPGDVLVNHTVTVYAQRD